MMYTNTDIIATFVYRFAYDDDCESKMKMCLHK